MVSMKTDKCPSCGGIVLKLAGKASKLCHDKCMDCRTADREREYDRALAQRAALTTTEAEKNDG